MHEKGVVHRDLKPENILIFKEGIPKLADFSVSMKKDNPDEMLLRLGTTKIYQPPEVWEDMNCLDFSHDVWSLGLILWEMVFNCLPFKIKNEASLKDEIVSFTPIFPEDNTDICPNLKSLLTGMLSRDRNQRWSISEIEASPWLQS